MSGRFQELSDSRAVELNQVSDRWGIELNGPEADQKMWRKLLKPPFDPFVEEVKDERGTIWPCDHQPSTG